MTHKTSDIFWLKKTLLNAKCKRYSQYIYIDSNTYAHAYTISDTYDRILMMHMSHNYTNKVMYVIKSSGCHFRTYSR